MSGMNTRMVIKITLRPKGSIDSSLAVTLSLFTDRIKSKPADAFGLLYRDQPGNSCRCNQAREKGRWQCWPRSRAAYGCSIRITKMRVTRAVALTPKISASWRFEFAGRKIVVGIRRVAEPVRLLHRLKFVRPRRQVLSLSCGLGCLGAQILTRGPIRLLHGRASTHQNRFKPGR